MVAVGKRDGTMQMRERKSGDGPESVKVGRWAEVEKFTQEVGVRKVRSHQLCRGRELESAMFLLFTA